MTSDCDDRSAPPGALRPARPDDSDEICEVFLRSRRAAMPWLAVLHTDEETRWWVTHVVVAEHDTFVLTDGATIRGFAALQGEWLQHLYVDPSAQRRGMGRRLLDEAKRRNPAGLALHVFARNVAARGFYEAASFTRSADPQDVGNEEGEPGLTYRWAPAP